MIRRWLSLLLAAAFVAASLPVGFARAGGPGYYSAGYCGPGCCPPAPCAWQTVSKIVMVPQVTYKTVSVPCVVMKPVVHQRTVTVSRLVPETRMVTRQVTILEPQQRTRIESYQVCRLEYEDVEREITVMVPHDEIRQGMRTVCKPVLVQEMQNVCQDAGHWETQQVVDCHGCASACKVWRPQIIQKQVPVMVCKQQIVQVPYQYHVTVCKPEPRRVVERVAKPVVETHNRNVNYFVCVEKQVNKNFQETFCREVQENVVMSCTELVPTTVQKRVAVPVCTMVPKTVLCRVPVPCGVYAPAGKSAVQGPTQAPSK